MRIENPTVDKKTQTLTFGRDMSDVSGDVAYTGFGFKPRALFFTWGIGSTLVHGSSFVDNGGHCNYQNFDYAGTLATSTVAGVIMQPQPAAGGNYQRATFLSYDADGFTITWLKAGLPTGTLTVIVFATE